MRQRVLRDGGVAASALGACALALSGLWCVGPRALQAQPREGARVDRVAIAEGGFVMGDDTLGEGDERPRHRAVLPAFRIDRTEVTQADWRRCVGARRCTSPRPLEARFVGPRLPQMGVSWFQAAEYCAWAGGRLPSEAEWERAARGPEGRTFPWGEATPTPRHAVFGRADATGFPDPVGTHPQGDSPEGVHDLAGNVWEWVASPYDPYAYRHPETPATCATAMAALGDLRRLGVRGFTGSNPLPNECERVLRGGGWNYGGAGLRSSNRVHHPPRYRLVMSGFRCADDGPASAPSAPPL